MLLTQLQSGESGRVIAVSADKMRLQELGFVTGAVVTVLFCAPLGDPVAYDIGGVTVALRGSDAQNIEVAKLWD